MAGPYLSEIRVVSFNFPPQGWAFCNGKLLPINQNQALFALVGTAYGGDGITTFALPNLQGRAPLQMGSGLGGGSYVSGRSVFWGHEQQK
jgi:microcystin-dependent protein